MDDSLVNEILQDIQNDKIKTKQELQQEIKLKIYEVYKPFLSFDTNQDNFKETYDKLDGYKYATVSELEEGRYIRFLNTKFFYDIKLQKGGFINSINKKKKLISLINGNKIIKIFYPSNTIFMKLNESDRVKQLILESEFL